MFLKIFHVLIIGILKLTTPNHNLSMLIYSSSQGEKISLFCWYIYSAQRSKKTCTHTQDCMPGQNTMLMRSKPWLPHPSNCLVSFYSRVIGHPLSQSQKEPKQKSIDESVYVSHQLVQLMKWDSIMIFAYKRHYIIV